VAPKPQQIEDSVAEPAARAPASRWLFPVAFASQTIGATIIIVKGVAIYRQLMAAPASYDAESATTAWALAAIALIQAGYWPLYYAPARQPRMSNAMLGHIVQFASRLVFMVVTAVFSFVFIQKRIGNIPPYRVALILAMLFSLFCYMLQVQRLGSAIAAGAPRGARPPWRRR